MCHRRKVLKLLLSATDCYHNNGHLYAKHSVRQVIRRAYHGSRIHYLYKAGSVDKFCDSLPSPRRECLPHRIYLLLVAIRGRKCILVPDKVYNRNELQSQH